MRKLIIVSFLFGTLAACQKEEIKRVSSEKPTSSESEPTRGETKTKESCKVYYRDGSFLTSGWTCKGKGSECGRRDLCRASSFTSPSFPESADDIIFEGMTRKEFAAMWNTEEGMEILMSKGVYAAD